MAAGEHHAPEGIEEFQRLPALLGAMDAGIVTEVSRQLVPLASGAHPVDHAIEGMTGINTGAAEVLGRIEAIQQTLHHLPQVVGNRPDRG